MNVVVGFGMLRGLTDDVFLGFATENGVATRDQFAKRRASSSPDTSGERVGGGAVTDTLHRPIGRLPRLHCGARSPAFTAKWVPRTPMEAVGVSKRTDSGDSFPMIPER